MPRTGGDFGRYHIDSQIGIGGMGVVFRATDTQLKRPVALKVVSAQFAESQEYLQRFQREAEVMARVDSPYIVQIFDYGTQDGCPYLASQYVGGGDLAQLLKRNGPLSPTRSALVGSQIASALASAHRAGVIHRDVKPSNVLMREQQSEADDPHAYLCDFGIAQPNDGQGFTQTGGVTGSWGFLAPERVNGQPATPASDIYAVGCVLWCCLTGQQPFSGTDIQVAMAHLNSEVPQLQGADEQTRRLNHVLSRSLAKDPAQRYGTADELRADLIAAANAAPAERAVPVPEATAVRAPIPPGAGAAYAGQVGGPSGPGMTPSGPGGGAGGSSGGRRGLLIGIGALVVVLVLGGIAWAVLANNGGSNDHQTSGKKTTGTSTTGKKKAPGVPGDNNGDGKADLTWVVSGDSVSQRITGLSQAGGYGSAIVHKWAGGFNLFSGDVNGDGLSDLVSVDADQNEGITIRVVDHATGTDKTDVIHTNKIKLGSYVVPGDFNGDGHPDFAFFESTNKNVGQIYVSLGNKDGTWSTPTLWFTHKDWDTFHYFIEPGDFNGDGKTDLSVFFDLQNNVKYNPKLQKTGRDATGLLTSAGNKFNPVDSKLVREFPVPVNVAQGGVSWQLNGDITGDGKPSEVYVNQYPAKRTVQVSTWNDKTGFSPLSKPWYDGKSAKQLTGSGVSNDTFDLADINGDGKDDLVILHQVVKGTYQVLWQESTGTKLLPPKVLMTYASPLPRAWNGQLAKVF